MLDNMASRKKNRYKIGDSVKIVEGPPEKLGRVGTITSLFQNGAVIRLNSNWFTIVQFIHLKKIHGPVTARN